MVLIIYDDSYNPIIANQLYLFIIYNPFILIPLCSALLIDFNVVLNVGWSGVVTTSISSDASITARVSSSKEGDESIKVIRNYLDNILYG